MIFKGYFTRLYLEGKKEIFLFRVKNARYFEEFDLDGFTGGNLYIGKQIRFLIL